MIDYEKLQDAQLKDLIDEDSYKYYCIHVVSKKRCFTIKGFCEVLDNHHFENHLNIKMVEKVVIPYLIETGALIPSIQDPINYACIETPHLYHRVRWYHNPNEFRYTSLIHPDENRRLLTIQRIKDIYFDENGTFRLPEHQKNSLHTKQTIIKLYNYLLKCHDCPQKDIEDVERYLIDNNIIPDEEMSAK